MLEERPKLRYIKIDELELWEQANVRKKQALVNIDDLAQNIKKVGIRVPLLVRDKKDGMYGVFSGQRRLIASRMAELGYVPCFVFETISLREAQILSLSENIYRQQMSPDDISDAAYSLFQQLKDRTKVAKALGVHENTVKKYLGYRNVPEPIKDIVSIGKITAQQAIDISSKFPDDRALKVAKELSSIKARDKKAKYYHAVKTSTPNDDLHEIKKRAEKLGKIQRFEIFLPDSKSVMLEKIAYQRKIAVEDILMQIIEQWTDEYEKGLHRE